MVIAGTKWLKIIYVFSFIAVLVLLPWSFKLSAMAIVAMMVSGLLSTTWLEKQRLLKEYPNVFLFLIFYGVYLVGMTYTKHFSEGLNSLEQKAFLLLPVVVASSTQLNENQIRRGALAFVYSNAVLTLVCFGLSILSVIYENGMVFKFDSLPIENFIVINEEPLAGWMRFSYTDLSNPFIHPLYLAMYLVFSVAILFHYQKESKLQVALKWILAVWFFIVIILLATRMGILILCLIAGSIILLNARSKKLASLYLFLLCLTTVGAIFASPITRFRALEEPLSTPLEFPKKSDQWNSVNLRFLEWSSGLIGIKNNGLLGTGTGGTIASLQTNYRNFDLGALRKDYNTHNQYLETLLEIGLAGFLALMASLLIPLISAIKNKNRLLIYLVLIIGVAGLTECVLEKAHGLIFYVAFLSLFMFSKKTEI